MDAETLDKALPSMSMATRAIHADDFVSPHRAIAPAMHVAVNFRYARDPDDLVPEENKDVSPINPSMVLASLESHLFIANISQTPPKTPTSTPATQHQTQPVLRSSSAA